MSTPFPFESFFIYIAGMLPMQKRSCGKNRKGETEQREIEQRSRQETSGGKCGETKTARESRAWRSDMRARSVKMVQGAPKMNGRTRWVVSNFDFLNLHMVDSRL